MNARIVTPHVFTYVVGRQIDTLESPNLSFLELISEELYKLQGKERKIADTFEDAVHVDTAAEYLVNRYESISPDELERSRRLQLVTWTDMFSDQRDDLIKRLKRGGFDLSPKENLVEPDLEQRSTYGRLDKSTNPPRFFDLAQHVVSTYGEDRDNQAIRGVLYFASKLLERDQAAKYQEGLHMQSLFQAIRNAYDSHWRKGMQDGAVDRSIAPRGKILFPERIQQHMELMEEELKLMFGV